MTDEPTNLVFEYLRRIDAPLDGIEKKQDILLDRISSLEGQFAVMKSDLALMRGDFARLEHRMDNFDRRLERIERQLELTDA
jgi:chromosome segregation ATPase